MLAKAEILWSRTCPLKCSYCSMVDGRLNTPSLEDWRKGIDNLKELDTVIIVFFGAEPLYDFDKLPEVIMHAENLDIATTVITSGYVKDVKDKLSILHEYGLRSLSVSYDIVDLNVGSKLKTSRAVELLHYFRSFGYVRDLAAIVTLTKTNFRLLPDTIREMTDENIWTLFDPLHLDRKLPRTKCSSEGSEGLMFTAEDIPELKKMFEELVRMKNYGYLIHASLPYLEGMIEKSETFLGEYKWRCADDDIFPSWVTVDVDGYVYCCDDYHPESPFYMTELYDQWDSFKTFWKDSVQRNCPGCAWNNYEECHLISKLLVPKKDFTHSR